jgi:hypothetical protein
MNSAEFIKYISTPLTTEEMQLLYKAHDINYDKCDLYYDFILSLNRMVVSTFLGDDVINTETDIKNHYKWCVKEVINNFKDENIIFKDTDNIEEYFYYFYIEIFYNDPHKKDVITKLDKLAFLSFDYNRVKTRSDMDVLLELYRYFEKSLDFKIKKK